MLAVGEGMNRVANESARGSMRVEVRVGLLTALLLVVVTNCLGSTAGMFLSTGNAYQQA